jgi:hypothetical protein
VLLIPLWLGCRHGQDAAALGLVIYLEKYKTLGLVAVLCGVAYQLLYRVPVKRRTLLALAGTVVVAIAIIGITLLTQQWLYDDTFCPPPWRLRWVSPL